MTNVGYARVSSHGQNLSVQLDKLQARNCTKIYQEKESAVSSKRPILEACLDYVREGDTLIITKLDRLARSTIDLCHIVKTLETKKVNLEVIDQNIETHTSTGRLLFNMLGAIAQFETEIRAERQAEGIRKAKSHGVRFGRVKTITNKQIIEMKEKRQQGTLIKELMKMYGLSKASVYRYLKE
jgi:DNA invertase Pin-like site-specific DNA recombinase